MGVVPPAVAQWTYQELHHILIENWLHLPQKSSAVSSSSVRNGGSWVPPLLGRILIGLILCKSFPRNHSCSEFMSWKVFFMSKRHYGFALVFTNPLLWNFFFLLYLNGSLSPGSCERNASFETDHSTDINLLWVPALIIIIVQRNFYIRYESYCHCSPLTTRIDSKTLLLKTAYTSITGQEKIKFVFTRKLLSCLRAFIVWGGAKQTAEEEKPSVYGHLS